MFYIRCKGKYIFLEIQGFCGEFVCGGVVLCYCMVPYPPALTCIKKMLIVRSSVFFLIFAP